MVKSYINIMDFKFERVRGFIYLGALISENSDMTEKVRRLVDYTGILYHNCLLVK